MKKSMMLGVVMVLFGWQMAWASNDKPISPEQLPAKAKAMIEQYFPGEKIAFAKQESEVCGKRSDGQPAKICGAGASSPQQAWWQGV